MQPTFDEVKGTKKKRTDHTSARIFFYFCFLLFKKIDASAIIARPHREVHPNTLRALFDEEFIGNPAATLACISSNLVSKAPFLIFIFPIAVVYLILGVANVRRKSERAKEKTG